MRLRMLLVLLATMGLACSDEAPMAPNQTVSEDLISGVPIRDLPLDQVDKMLDLVRIAEMPDRGLAAMSQGRSTVYVPAGSVDALADAFAAAGPRGTVILEPGLHVESATVTITQPATLRGMEGAILQVAALPYPDSEELDPALYVRNTRNVRIWGVDLRPEGVIGGVGILVENSRGTVIAYNEITSFQDGVILEQGDHTRIWRNKIFASDLWQTGEAEFGHGITVVNGDFVRIRENEVANGFFGIWACDNAGQLSQNSVRNTFSGIILCNVPPGLLLPDGTVLASEVPATGWIVTNNVSSENLDVGYFVTDGSNNNFLINNAASNNSLADPERDVDLEVLGDSTFFGFLTPTAFENTIVAGTHTDLIAVDCGVDSRFFGIEPIEADCR